MISINLLPEEEKRKRAAARFNLRLALVCSALVVLAILAVTFSYSANLIFAAELRSLRSRVDQEKNLLETYHEVKNQVVFINDRVQELDNLTQNRESFALILESLNKNTPSEIQVTSFSLDVKTKPEGKITGTAPSKEKVVELVNLLEASAYFQNVQFESSSSSPEKIVFNLNLSLEEGGR